MIVSPIEIESRHARYNASGKGRSRRTDYRQRTGKYVTTSKYLAKPFIAVNGQAVTGQDGKQIYVYIGLSTGQSKRNDNGLSTLDILTFLSRNLPESKDAIPVIFGGGYDFNFWMRSLSEEKLRALYSATFRDSPITVGAYEIRWEAGKSFTIKSGGGKTVTINDVSSFFQTTFPEALDEWFNGEYEGRGEILWAKTGRDNFNHDDLERIVSANDMELARLVDLCEILRVSLDRANMRPRRWKGPGNSVVTLFRRHKIKEHMDKNVPAPVMSASRYAYAGGRIEMVKYGSVTDRNSYQYDINSAYPEAIAELPSLAGGSWQYHEGNPGYYPFALYKVSAHAKNAFHPTPMFTRGALGSICYPLHAYNWVWSPEIKSIEAWSKKLGGEYNIVEAWVFTPATDTKPFEWIKDIYSQRAELKAAGDSAQLAIKTVMQSIYGKLGQQLGFLEAKGRRAQEIPPYHQLEWAGFVTSFTRAKMFIAALEKPDAIIAFETDALFMSEPLEKVTVGTKLGEWKLTEYTELTYVQSGIYSAKTLDGKQVVKVRGFDVDSVTPATIKEALAQGVKQREVHAPERRFIGLGIALQIPEMKFWCEWVDQERILRCYPLGKRIHELCECGVKDTEGLLLDFWHQTLCPVREQVSREYPVEWINPDPEMKRLEELRRNISEWD